MKKTLFTVLLVMVLQSVFAQIADCNRFKNGKFRISDPNAGGITIIERRGDYQVENNESMKSTIRFKVTWLDNCTYTLKPVEILRNENHIPYPMDAVLKVTIIKTGPSSYWQESSINNGSFVYKSEVTKIQ